MKSTLELLRITDDTLLSIPDDALTQFDQLSSATFTKNSLEFLPAISNTLTELRLNYNNIERVIDINVEESSRLEALILRNNRISFISFTFLKKLPRLHILALQNNQLHTLPYPDAPAYQSAIRLGVYVGGNPWICNASMAWLLSVTPVRTIVDNRFNFKYFYIYAYGGMVCHGPPEMKGTVLGHMERGNGL